MKKLALVSLIAVLCTPIAALAESNVVAPAGANAVATSKLNFRIGIPRVLYLRVGTGSSFANNGAVDLIDFDVPGASVGTGSAVGAKATSGDLGNGAVTVRVAGNDGNITLNSTTTGQLTTGAAGEVIGWDQINVVPTALATSTPNFTNGAIPHPSFNNTSGGGAGTPTTLTATARRVRQEGQWTFTYANADMPAAGSYGGINANNSLVSYTATMP